MRLSVSVPTELAEAVQARATAERRPLSHMVALLLEAALASDAAPLVTIPATPIGSSGKVFKGPDPK